MKTAQEYLEESMGKVNYWAWNDRTTPEFRQLIFDTMDNYAEERVKFISLNNPVSGSLPDDWKARPIDLKSGWKNNAKILAEIVTAINNEVYVEDENAEMEKIDIVLEWIKSKYNVVRRQ